MLHLLPSKLHRVGNTCTRTSLKVTRSFSNLLILKNDDAFNKQKELPGKKILYFTASWCPPCKAIGPVFETLSKKHTTLSFVKIDVDNLPDTALDYGIRSVPTFVFINGQKAISQVTD